MPVIGFLGASSPETNVDRLRAFHLGLKETGHVEGDNVAVLYRWAENNIDRMPELAADLARRRVAVLVSFGNAPALAAKAATTTIPLVFGVGEDPAKMGLVASLARPGGNLTGVNFFSAELVAKRLELLRELVPGAVKVAVLMDPAAPPTATTLQELEAAARSMGCESRSSKPAAAARSTGPSQPLRTSGPTRFSSDPASCSTAGAFNWSTWRRSTRSPRHIRSVNISKPAG
jgi:ABC transporter substrate binding protein